MIRQLLLPFWQASACSEHLSLSWFRTTGPTGMPSVQDDGPKPAEVNPSSVTPSFDLEHPERLDFTGVDGPSLVRDLGYLAPDVSDAMMRLLRSGDSSRMITELILAHPCPVDFPNFDYASVLYRVEYVRRHVKLNENLSSNSDEDSRPAGHGSKAEVSGRIYVTTELQAKREQVRALLAEVRQWPGLLFDIVAGLLLTGETSQTVTELILRQAERGAFQAAGCDEMLERVELLDRYVQWLKQQWNQEYGGAVEDGDALADYVRRRLRGLSRKRQFWQQC